ncbi:MAG TPA: 1-deoxy-D-xylulose-5-phosphate synthase [Candidatus Cloacimonadota bacterium]|nr:1-deoxy-D-xylulose-5-phosphate synthase [Candidatus Cloacimonadota bacterium]HPT71913.1 1-deoxy-D-xylulose-5-phosphate synthase [Candidatus Cloacimonadota bacterium]
MIIERVNHPNDIHSLTIDEMIVLAKELRKMMIEVTSMNGGHLAPSLGATDFTLALLKVFNLEEDSIVWDVGHQAYAFKILTGRRERFHTLRQMGGVSGFINRSESPFDAFGVGHSSTSISAAVGIAVGKEKNGEKGHTVAVIGDGALTGGMAFEAINHAGHLQQSKLIVVLNDNEMSISKNVGALQSYLASVLVSRHYNTLKKQVWDALHSLPHGLRKRFIYGAQKLEESLINILVPNIVFEDFGFKYVGPIDGHDIPRLIRIFDKAKNNMVGPILIHIVTRKGRGYVHAECNSAKFHGISPFDPLTGELKKPSGITYSSILGSTLCKLAVDNPKIIAVTAAMSEGTGLIPFEKRFPERFFDVGIAEQHAVTFSAGLATQGLKPFIAIYSTFGQRALDQIIHDVALQNLPVVLCLDRAGLVGEDGATHHGAFDISYIHYIPNILMMAPSDDKEFAAMLEFASEYKDGPIVIRYPRGQAPKRDREMVPIEKGKAEVVQKGMKIAFLAIGEGLSLARSTAEYIKSLHPDFDPSIVNMRFVKPMDTECLEKLADEVSVIVTFESNALIGGFGEGVKTFYMNSQMKVLSFGYPDKFVPHGKNDELMNLLHLTPEGIYQVLLNEKILEKKRTGGKEEKS